MADPSRSPRGLKAPESVPRFFSCFLLLIAVLGANGCSRTVVGGYTDSSDNKYRVYGRVYGAYPSLYFVVVLVFVLVSAFVRLHHVEGKKVHYHPYCQKVWCDQRKLEKGWEIAQNENLNLARLPIPPRGQTFIQLVTNEPHSSTCARSCAGVSR